LALVRLGGVAVALTAVVMCGRTLAGAWPDVRSSLVNVSSGWLAVALLAGAAGLVILAANWHRLLAAVDRSYSWLNVAAWFFAGELGKYVPGGIWPVVGRGELARRGGVSRSLSYTTTLLSMALMCAGAMLACGVLAPFVLFDGKHVGAEMLLLIGIPIAVVCSHPAVTGPVLVFLQRVSRGRVRLEPLPFRVMLALIGRATLAWVLIGGASVAVAHALGYAQNPSRVAFAAIAAWIVGFLLIPVPAGMGVRELVFAAVCGLDSGPAVAVAGVARLLLLITDGVGGVAGLLFVGSQTGRKVPVEQEVA
jgi:uncharacterized membrane protein YbhN (UPF0104 family)